MFTSTNKIFIDPTNYIKSCLVVGLTVVLPFFIMIELGFNSNNPLLHILPILILPLLVFVLFPFLKIAVGNNATYVIYNDELYQINRMPNDPGILANDARAAGNLMGNEAGGLLLGGALLLGVRGKRQKQKGTLLENEDLLKQVLSNTYTLKVNQTVSMKSFFNGYKVVVRVSNRNTRNTQVMFYIFPGYNDYEQLVEWFRKLIK